MTQWLSSDEQSLWREYLHFKRDLQARLDAKLREHQLSDSDYSVLLVIAGSSGGNVRVKQIAEATGWESSRLAHQLRRMESRDLIFRMPCPKDARGTMVSLTEAGEDLLAQTQPAHTEAVRTYFTNNLTDQEKAVLFGLFKHLTTTMPAYGAAAATPAPVEIDITDATLQPAQHDASINSAQSPQRDGSSSSHVQGIDPTTHRDSDDRISVS